MNGKFRFISMTFCAVAVAGLVYTQPVFAGDKDPFAHFYKGKPDQKAWGISRTSAAINHDDDHFAKGDVFVLKNAGDNILFIPGKSMKTRGWRTIPLGKVEASDIPILCMEGVALSHGHGADNKAPHVFAIGPADDGSSGIIIQFGDMGSGDNCKEFSFHGGVAHGEND